MKHYDFIIFFNVNGFSKTTEVVAVDLLSAQADIESLYGESIEILNSTRY